MSGNNPVETRAATVLKDKNGIILITMKDAGKLDEFDVIDLNLVIRHLAQKEPSYKLLDARASWSMDSKAKLKAKQEDRTSNTAARAIVVGNSVKATLIKFLQGFSKKDYAQEIFSDWDDAYQWLLEKKQHKK
jgi:hypothetical protein